MKQIKAILSLLTCHPLSWLGCLAVTFAAIFTAGYLILTVLFQSHNPYTGVLFLIFAPPAFFAGLLMIPAGIAIVAYRRRQAEGLEGTSLIDIVRLIFKEKIIETKAQIPALSLFLVLTSINALIVLTIVIHGFHIMDSTEFCGEVCHTAMAPEYNAYQVSNHAHVPCVDCHIGPGTVSFVKAKLNGMKQLLGIVTGHYHRPIHAPVPQLRAAKEICSHCHWPEKIHPQKLKVITKYDSDRQNSKLYTVMLLNIGSPDHRLGEQLGIHWHANPEHRITYISENDQRHKIDWIKLENKGQKPKIYKSLANKLSEQDIKEANKRIMDCIDCHNRATHRYQMPHQALDRMFAENVSLEKVPYLKKVGLEILAKEFSEKEIKQKAIYQAVIDFYQQRTAEWGQVEEKLLAQAAEQIQQIYFLNVVPRMNISWGTYPDHLGHTTSPGCFRCHDNTHVDEKGKAIPSDCRICHTILAIDEKNPEVLKQLKYR